MTVFNELTMRSGAGDAGRGWNAGSRSRLVLTMSTTALLLVGANLATPLYPALQERLGLGPFAVTVAFSSYVLALIAGLVLYGHWSDHIGRRTALVLSVLVGLAGEIVFATAGGLAGLVTGRVLQGAAVAMVTGASSAALRELLPHPTTTPFAVHCTMLIAVLVPLWTLHARPAIAPAPGSAAFKALRPRRLCLPPGVRTRFQQAAAVGFLSFALFGFSLSLAPGYFARTLGVSSPAGIGALAALVLIGSATAQLVGRPRVRALPGALVGMALGTALIGVAGALSSLPLLLLAALVAGAAQGVAFRTAFNALSVAVPAADNARVVSAVYVVTYLGSAVPVLGLGVLAGAVGVPSSVHWFAGTLAGACLLLAGTVRLRARRGPRRGQQA